MVKEKNVAPRFTRAGLKTGGFQGFHHLYERREEKFGKIPAGPGVYVVLRESQRPVEFLSGDESLAQRWIPDAQAIYFGQADNLRERVSGVSLKGAGRSVGNWSGQVIWQVSDTENLTVAWLSTSSAPEATSLRNELLDSFLEHYGRPPFGNRRRKL